MHDLLKSLFPVQDALKGLAQAGAEARGAIFTKREVVEFILDLCGYTSDQDLLKCRLLEPSVGRGDFLLPAVSRLISSLPQKARTVSPELCGAIRGVEIHDKTLDTTRKELLALLNLSGFSKEDSRHLTDKWLIAGDYLLTELPGEFTHVVGNPPYVRQEQIPDALIEEYRDRFKTVYDRADLYIPFIEKSLESLSCGGVLGFICADRWMKNKYGAPLRAFVAKRFHLSAYVDMVNTDAFHSEVIAYPAITIIRRQNGSLTHIAHRPKINSQTLSDIVPALLGHIAHQSVISAAHVANGDEPWMLHSLDKISVIRRLESTFPLLEETGCKVGIGVATGADKVFVGDYETLPVEADRKLPLSTTRDILSGRVLWTGKGVINPFRDDGQLVDLEAYPKLKTYLESHEKLVRARNCAKKDDRRWYRTIDRITPALAKQKKLLIPDIKGEAHVVYEEGKLYPHHNLYYIISETWDLHALQAVLLSGIAKLFVSAYSVQMAGGFLRFQAQYLRRIRLPYWKDVPAVVQNALTLAGQGQDRQAANEIVAKLYRLSSEERIAISESSS